MSVLQVIGAILTLTMELFKLWREKNAEVKSIRNEAMKNAIDAIDRGDASEFNLIISRLR